MAQCVVELFFKKLFEKNEVEAALQNLDQLTQDEARMAVAQTLGVAHGLREGTQHLRDLLIFFLSVRCIRWQGVDTFVIPLFSLLLPGPTVPRR